MAVESVGRQHEYPVSHQRDQVKGELVTGKKSDIEMNFAPFNCSRGWNDLKP